MNHEVIVVGGGIGGLTVAALLANRGLDTCLLERQSHVGGCLAQVEHMGQSFDPTFGFFSGWETAGIWPRVFSELPVAPPTVTKLSTNFVVRLPNGKDVPVSSNHEAFESSVADAFPDCADKAVQFLRATFVSRADPAALKETSEHFRAFIDAQLSFLAQRTIETVEPTRLADTLKLATGDLWEIDGGIQSLVDCLATSFKQSGGHLRLNSPVLRLAYAETGTPHGVDLLSGERMSATRAIVSNLTAWDTYGKLVGLRHTPPDITAQLRQMNAWGVYQIFILLDESAAASTPARKMMFASSAVDAPPEHLMLSIGSPRNPPDGKRCATVTSFTNVDEWFAFHEDASWHEERDQSALEKIWGRLHLAAPELADSAEIFETATPQTYYESTRRKMGMIGSPSPVLRDASSHINNLFLVGDTTAETLGSAGVAEAAYRLCLALVR
jgi:phytoene dehydrogenase-like protein